MNNFFLDDADYDLFRKAFRSTKNEPVVINILSTDDSLEENKEKQVSKAVPAPRKNQSSKYDPSPFGKFFGPRKPQRTNVDMKDFSSWKNKNYRQAEKTIGEEENRPSKFSMADFMRERFQDSRYHELDQAKSEAQKPIDELSTSDPQYKKFSLDSYMSKLEEQTKVKSEFEENDDILEPLGLDEAKIVPDSTQDENFGFGSDISAEKIAFDDHLEGGEKYKFEAEELDKVKARLEKMEREANNIKDKPNNKVIEGNEIPELKDEKLDLSKLLDDEDKDMLDDIEKINDKLSDSEDDLSLTKDKPQVKHKKFFEVNKNPNFEESQVSQGTSDSDDSGETSSDIQTDKTQSKETQNPQEESLDEQSFETGENKTETISDEVINKINGDEEDDDDLDFDEQEYLDDLLSDDKKEPTSEIISTEKINRSDILTKSDLKDITDDFMEKFSKLVKKDENQVSAEPQYESIDETSEFVNPYGSQVYAQPSYEENKLQSQIQELMEANERSDKAMQEKLRLAELEKENMSREYESKIRAMEQDFKQSYEDIKNKIYLDKLDRDVKLQEVEKKFKKKTAQIEEEEKESSKKQLVGEIFKKELKSNVDICNLEMDKKLLEVATKLHKIDAEDDDTDEEPVIVEEPLVEESEDVEETENVEEEKPKKKSATKKSTTKSTKRRRTAVSTSTKKRAPRSPNRRKIDSDIIGGIFFD